MCDLLSKGLKLLSGISIIRISNKFTRREKVKKAVIAIILLAAFVFPASAFFEVDKNGKDMGVGIYLGSPFGITAKYDLDQNFSVVGGLDINPAFQINGGLQYKLFDFSIEKLDFNFYTGISAYVGLSQFSVGLNVPFGISYYLKDPSLELFLEIGPSFDFKTTQFSPIGGIGARYEFDL